jgi:hypothetical protein
MHAQAQLRSAAQASSVAMLRAREPLQGGGIRRPLPAPRDKSRARSTQCAQPDSANMPVGRARACERKAARVGGRGRKSAGEVAGREAGRTGREGTRKAHLLIVCAGVVPGQPHLRQQTATLINTAAQRTQSPPYKTDQQPQQGYKSSAQRSPEARHWPFAPADGAILAAPIAPDNAATAPGCVRGANVEERGSFQTSQR